MTHLLKELTIKELRDHKLDECAAVLRKAAEANIKRFAQDKLGMIFEGGEFRSLSDNLRDAKRRLESEALRRFRSFLKVDGYDDAAIDQLIALEEADWSARATLDVPAQGILRSRAKSLRALLKEIRKSDTEALEVLEKIDEVTDRILNPGASGYVTSGCDDVHYNLCGIEPEASSEPFRPQRVGGCEQGNRARARTRLSAACTDRGKKHRFRIERAQQKAAERLCAGPYRAGAGPPHRLQAARRREKA